jgi:tetratricopeptide (TPR) repeat protein
MVYCGLAASRLMADRFAQSANELQLRRAVRLDSGNAEYWHSVGIHNLALQAPNRALPWLRSAVALNPNSARYSMDLSIDEQLVGDFAGERSALEHALAVDPRTPSISWKAANLFLAAGLTDEAMKHFRTVLENDASLAIPAIRTAWEIRPDVDSLLEQVIPPSADMTFLQFLLSKGETAAAARTWEKVNSLQQDVDRADLLGYEHYLLTHGEVSQASRVWQQGTKLSDLVAYQPSPENLLVNGDFSLDILNGGFDWVHQPVDGVSVALDTGELHSGSRSLQIVFDGAGISDAGISQLVVVEPGDRYEFGAFYKARDMDGAGSVQLAIQDAYQGTPLLASEDLRNADFWKNIDGSFVTPTDTHLIRVHIIRVPAGRPIRGKLWIDGLRLTHSASETK